MRGRNAGAGRNRPIYQVLAHQLARAARRRSTTVAITLATLAFAVTVFLLGLWVIHLSAH